MENNSNAADVQIDGQNAETQQVLPEAEDSNPQKTDENIDNDDSLSSEENVSESADKELNTVRKALDKRNRYINNQRNRIRSLEAEIEKLKSGSVNKQAAPELEKFDSVLDYMKADQNYNLEQKLAEQAQKAQIAALEQQQNMAMEQHAEAVAAQVTELLNSNQEFKAVISANVNVINDMPPHIEKMLMEIDNAPAATYALAKEGLLASIYSMPPTLAAAYIAQAEILGKQYLRQSAQKTTPQPPKPIGSLKGTGKATTKSLDEMSPDQLMKWLKT